MNYLKTDCLKRCLIRSSNWNILSRLVQEIGYWTSRAKFVGIEVLENITAFTVVTVRTAFVRSTCKPIWWVWYCVSCCRRLFRVFQTKHPPEPGVHVQGTRRTQRQVSHWQNPPKPVPRLSAQQVFSVGNEQGRWVYVKTYNYVTLVYSA